MLAMASIEKRGRNSWRLTVELGYDANGERIRERKKIEVDDPIILRAPKRLEEHLNKELTKFQLEVEAGNYIKPEKMTFNSFADKFVNEFVLIELEETTQDNYQFHINKRLRLYFGSMYMAQIKTMHLTHYLNVYLQSPEARLDGKSEPLGSATIVYNYRVLRSMFEKAVEWKVLKKDDNPMKDIKKPKEDDVEEKKYYDEKEIAALFKALEEEPIHIRVLIMLAITTGMRRGEMAGLEWKNVDLDNGIINIVQTIPKFKNGQPVLKGPKNKKSKRKIAISPAMVEELKLYKQKWELDRNALGDKWQGGDFEFIFYRPNGLPSDPQRLTKRWIAFHRKHQLKPIRLHELRHTSVSWMIFKKVHLEAIARRVGHSNTKMMEIYGHIFESVDKAASSVFDDMIKTQT